MDWDHILQTILNKPFLHVLSRVGVQSAFFLSFFIILSVLIGFRYTTHADNLDTPAGQQLHEHTDTLLEAFTLKELWDEYGIVGDLLVSDF